MGEHRVMFVEIRCVKVKLMVGGRQSPEGGRIYQLIEVGKVIH
jgi:hypothetical protein